MASRGSPWWLVVILVCFGTAVGVFLQRFDGLDTLFRDFARAGFDLREVDLLFVRFGLSFFVRINRGTLLGGVVGRWLLLR